MTINVTTTKNTVTVNGDTQVVKVNSQGPQGPSFPDGDLGDVTSSNTGTTVTVNAGAIDDANIASNAAIAGSKIAPSFVDDITITNATPTINFVDTNQNSDFQINVENGKFTITDTTNNSTRLKIHSGGLFQIQSTNTKCNNFTAEGDIIVDGTVDGRDLAADGTKLDTVETNAKDDQTAAEIKTLLNSDGIVNAQIDASAAIAGTKISPDFGSQNVQTSGRFQIYGSGTNNSAFVINNGNESVFQSFVDGSVNADYRITYAGTGGSEIILQHDGTVQLAYGGTLRLKTQSSGVNVQGNITVTGTVDGRDIAADGTKLDGIEANAINASNTAITNKLPLAGGTLTGDLEVSTTLPKIKLTHTAADSDFSIRNQNGVFIIYDETVGTGRFKVYSSGAVEASGNLTVAGNLTVNGTTTTISTQNLLVEDHNIVIGKVSTPTDTTADGGGITLKGATDKTFNWINSTDSWTSSEHIALPDDKKLQLGNSQDLQIFHDGSANNIASSNGNLVLSQTSGTFRIMKGSTENIFKGIVDGAVELFYNNSNKLQTTSTGINVTGGITANGTTNKFGSGGDLTNHIGSRERLAIIGNSTDGSMLHIRGGSPAIFFDQSGSNTPKIYQDDVNLAFYAGTPASEGINVLLLLAGGNVRIPNDNAKLQIGASQDLQLYHDSNNSIIANSTGTTFIKGLGGSGNTIWLQPQNNESSAKFNPNGDVELFYDHSLKFATTSTGVKVQNTGASALLLFQKDTDALGYLESQTSKVVFGSSNNHPVTITQNSGTALNIDTSKNIQIPNDNAKLQIGASQDLELYHESSNSLIANNTGTLLIRSDALDLRPNTNNGEVYLRCTQNGSVELRFDTVKKLETTSTGATVTGSLQCTLPNAHSEGITLQQENSKAVRFLTNAFRSGASQGLLSIQSAWTGTAVATIDTTTVGSTSSKGAEIKFKTTHAGGSLTERVKITSTGNLQIPADNAKLQIGAGQDLELFYDGSNSHIKNATGHLIFKSDNFQFKDKESGDEMVKMLHDGAVELYFDNSKKFETTSSGVDITNVVQIGTSNDQGELRIGHDGSSYRARIVSNSSNSLEIDADGPERIQMHGGVIYMRPLNSEKSAAFVANGTAELYFDDSRKLQTTSTGATVTTTSAANSIKNITTSTSAPSGGSDGDLWFTYIA